MSTLIANKIALLKILIDHYKDYLDESEIDFDSISLSKTAEEILVDLTKIVTKDQYKNSIPEKLKVSKKISNEYYLKPGFEQKCAFEEYYRLNPDYTGTLGLYCSCPKCSPTATTAATATTSAIKTNNPVYSVASFSNKNNKAI